MSDSKKLFLCAAGCAFLAILRGCTPVIIDQPFDGGSFALFLIIAVVVFVLGIIKMEK